MKKYIKKSDVNKYKEAKKQHLHCDLLGFSRDYELFFFT